MGGGGLGHLLAWQLVAAGERVLDSAGQDHFASCNATAPVEVSSGNRKTHWLSLRGNRRLNLAIHMAAITQTRYRHSGGRGYHERNIAEGKTHKRAPRWLKRRLSDAEENPEPSLTAKRTRSAWVIQLAGRRFSPRPNGHSVCESASAERR